MKANNACQWRVGHDWRSRCIRRSSSHCSAFPTVFSENIKRVGAKQFHSKPQGGAQEEAHILEFSYSNGVLRYIREVWPYEIVNKGHWWDCVFRPKKKVEARRHTYKTLRSECNTAATLNQKHAIAVDAFFLVVRAVDASDGNHSAESHTRNIAGEITHQRHWQCQWYH